MAETPNRPPRTVDVPPPGYSYDPVLSDSRTAGFTDEHGEQWYSRLARLGEPCPRCSQPTAFMADAGGDLRERCEDCDVERCPDCGAWTTYTESRGWHHLKPGITCFLHQRAEDDENLPSFTEAEDDWDRAAEVTP